MSHQLHNSLVRILTADGDPAGVGFVASENLPLTCAHVEEAEIKFGLKTIGEAGFFAVGKVGGEMNYEVTLKWRKEKSAEKTEQKKAG